MRVTLTTPTAGSLGTGELFRVPLEIAAAAPPGTYPLAVERVVISDASSGGVTPAGVTPGSVVVEAAGGPVAIPALGPWGLAALISLLLLAGTLALRRGGGGTSRARRRLALVVVAALVGASALAAQGAEPGDANGDGTVDAADIPVIVDQILERQSAPGNPDCTVDSLVDVRDTICVAVASDRGPTLAPIADRSVREQEVVALTAAATDPDLPADALAWSLVQKPTGAAIDPEDGAFVWVPAADQVGTHPVTVRVTDAEGHADERSFTVTVRERGGPPVLDSIADQTTVAESSLTVDAHASDPDLPDDTLAYSLTLAPSGMSIEPGSGALSWTPAAAQVGDHDVTVQVEDQAGLVDFTSFVARVRPVNTAPVARDDVYEARLGVPLSIGGPGVLGNDSDPQGDALSARLEDDAAKGDLTLRADGGFDYRLDPSDRTTDVELALQCEAAIPDSHFQTNGTVAVGDVDGDGVDEIVGTTVVDGRTFIDDLWILDAVDCSERLATGNEIEEAGGLTGENQLGLLDIDGDGTLEIIGTRGRYPIDQGGDFDMQHLIALHPDGTLAWPGDGGSGTSPILAAGVNGSYRYAGPTFADLDGDGTVEIVMPFSTGFNYQVYSGVVVYNAEDGSVAWDFQSTFRQGGGNDQKAAYVADLDLDGTMEVIVGNSVLDHEGNLEFELPAEPAVGTSTFGHLTLAIANFDDDPYPELIGRDRAYHYLFEHDGTLAWKQPVANTATGQITVADFDGDGAPEFTYLTCTNVVYGSCSPFFLAMYDTDGSLLWSHEGQPEYQVEQLLSERENVTAFDANRDGAFDLVFHNDTTDELDIFDGRDGSKLASVPVGDYSGAQRFVTVADVDQDGDAELITSYTGGLEGSTTVWTGTPGHPLPAAPTFRNQWIFNEAYVNDDLSIPTDPVPHWLQPGRNGYHLITPEPDPLVGTTDSFTYAAGDGALESSAATVTLDILPAGNPPRFLTKPDTRATRGARYRYRPRVLDPDLGDTVSFRLTEGPDGMTLDPETGEVSWLPEANGPYDVSILALDTIGFATAQTYTLTVGDPVVVPDLVGQPRADAEAALADADLEVGHERSATHPSVPAGSVAAQTPVAGSVAEFGGTVDLVISLGPAPEDVDDDGDGFTENQGDCQDGDDSIFPGAADPNGDGVDQDCDGFDGHQPVAAIRVEPERLDLVAGETAQLTAFALFADGTSQIATGVVAWASLDPATATVSPGGRVTAVAGGGPATVTATRDAVVGSAEVAVTGRDEADDDRPEAEITAPADGESVLGPIEITGTAADPGLVRYELAISPAGEESFTVIGGGTAPVVDGVLTRLDPTVMLDDLYRLRLTVLDAGGNQSVDEVSVQVDGRQKIGNFSIRYQDLAVPLSGLPITVERTYDSRDKRRGEFGVGWRLGVQSIKVTCTNPLGEGWYVAKAGIAYTLLNATTHRCSVQVPGERAERFEFVPAATVSPIVPFSIISGSFQPLSGTVGRLESLEPISLAVVEPQPGEVTLRNDTDLSLFAPERFRYTAADGTRIDFGPSGLERVEDRNGNSLSFGPGGITHSSGQSVGFERDAQGRITRLTDPAGQVQTYAYSAAGDLIAHTDPLGNTTRFFYDAHHGLVRIEDPLGRPVARTEYDDEGRVISMTDGEGGVTQFDRDLPGRTETTILPGGATTLRRWDERGNVIEEADEDGVSTQYSWDDRDDLESITNARGSVETFDYDSQGRMTAITHSNGAVFRITPNAFDQVERVEDPMGHVTSYTYDARGNVSTTTDPQGNTRTFRYDERGDLVAIERPGGGVEWFERNDRGQMVARVDPMGHRTTFEYDANGQRVAQSITVTTPGGPQELTVRQSRNALGRVIGQTDPGGHERRREIDAAGRPVATIDPLGRRSEMSWNGRDELVESRFPDGTRISLDRDARGFVDRLVERDGRTAAMNYSPGGFLQSWEWQDSTPDPGDNPRASFAMDDLGLLAELHGQNGASFVANHSDDGFVESMSVGSDEIHYEYDALDRKTARTDVAGRRTETVYDALGREVGTVFPDGSSISRQYDALGRVVRVVDEAGRATEMEYDPAGRLVLVRDALGHETRYGYDEAGRKVTQVDANGHTTSFEYTSAGRLRAIVRPGGGRTSFEYDDAGRLVRRTKADGESVDFAYDEADRLVRRTLGGEDFEATYDDQGRRLSTQDARGTTAYQYDDQGRLIEETQPDGSFLRYGYDRFGRVTSLETPSGTVGYAWDASGNLSKVTDRDGEEWTYVYDSLGRLQSRASPALTEEIEYDMRDRVTRVTFENASGDPVLQFDYARDPSGKILSVVALDGSRVDFTYDAAGRLIDERRTGDFPGDVAWTLDPVGNVLSRTSDALGTTSFAYDADDRLTEEAGPAGTVSFQYDAAGRLVGQSGAHNVAYDWSADDRLAGFTDDTGAHYNLGYDWDGLLVDRSGPGGEERYLQDRSGDLSRIVEVAGPAAARLPITYGRQPLSEGSGAGKERFALDAHSGVRALVGSTGITARSAYGAYGAELGPASGSRLGYRGEWREPALGTLYLRARHYDPASGRFLSTDPFGGDPMHPLSLNRYLYGNADPVQFQDPSGEFGEAAAVAIVGTFVLGELEVGAIQFAFGVKQLVFGESETKDVVKWSVDMFGFGLDAGTGLNGYALLVDSDCVPGQNRGQIRDGQYLSVLLSYRPRPQGRRDDRQERSVRIPAPSRCSGLRPEGFRRLCLCPAGGEHRGLQGRDVRVVLQDREGLLGDRGGYEA